MGGPTATTPDSVKDLIARIREKKLTYLTDKKLLSLSGTCQDIEKRNLDGLFLEAGCALGGSSILMASIKSAQRPLLIYDVFGMIPPPTDMDTQDVHDRYKTISEGKSTGIDGEKYYGYEANLYEIVLSNFRDFDIDCEKQNAQLIKGLLQETMTINQPVAFAHIDVDWYEPVMTCLTRIFPHLIVGGSIILDDYHDWGGCRKAADEYLQTVPGEFLLDDSAGSMKITRTTSKPA
jgi:asparagine synthase (glutamine-hydrolysing)